MWDEAVICIRLLDWFTDVMYRTSFDGKVPLSNPSLQKIVQFFLFECPVNGVSCRGKKFKELGWSGNKSFAKLKKELLSVAGSTVKGNYHPWILFVQMR